MPSAAAIIALSPWQVVAYTCGFFAALYATFALTCWALTRWCLPRIGFGRVLDPRPLRDRQLARELSRSALTIGLFGLGALLPWWMLVSGVAQLAEQPSLLRVLLEIIALFFWNELHFYACHRLLHTKPLRRFHAEHHRSITPTPFSVYAFHPVEALLLGSVPIIPMLLHDFSIAALLSLPVMSLALNTLGHANYEFCAKPNPQGALGASRRHQLHHAHYHGNYGFLLNVFDRLSGTEIPPPVRRHAP